jgi:hypothetical protein
MFSKKRALKNSVYAAEKLPCARLALDVKTLFNVRDNGTGWMLA